MGCDPDRAGLELVAWGLRTVGFLAGGRVVGALDPHLRVAGALLLAAFGIWLVLEPLAWTPRGGLWAPVALSLGSLGVGVVLAGPALAHAVAALLGATSCTRARLGSWAGEFVRPPVPSFAARLAGVALLSIAHLQTAGVG
jgi:putative Mn2+ efflux pump MntP